MKQIFPRNEYRNALIVVSACNPRGVTHALNRLAVTAATHYPNDTEFVDMVGIAEAEAAEYNGPTDGIWKNEQYNNAVRWLYDRTWDRDMMWQIGSDPAIALHIQALGNIMVNAVGRTMSREDIGRYGIADTGLYSTRTTQARIMAFGQHLTVVDDGHGWTRLSLEVGTNWLNLSEYGMRRMIEMLVPGRWAKSAEMIQVEEHVAVITGTVFSPYEVVAEQVRRHNELGFDMVFNPPVAIGGGL